MPQNKRVFILDGIALSPDDDPSKALDTARKKFRSVGVSDKDIELSIYKKSVDARKKSDIKLVYSVMATPKGESGVISGRLERIGARELTLEALSFEYGNEKLKARPLVVGMGPAGLFCALLLAEQGYSPIIIDRGDSVYDRVESLSRFYREHTLDVESNIQFGAGGAGTFSDGKLLTRINDPKCSLVLETFKKFGAPEDITLKAKPHIGTDILRAVIDNMLSHIEKLGAEVIYRCRLDSLCENPDGSVTAHTTRGDIVCGAVVLALGHSARDTYKKLIEDQFAIVPKPISVGVRIEHRRADIEKALYGDFAGHAALGAAEYALSDTKGERGVYTFCMCPGGEVVAAASEEGGVVVNGMSSYARDGVNSNCAVAVSIRPDEFEAVDGNGALGAIEFQRAIERRAYMAGGGGYAVPVQTVGDFTSGRSGSQPSYVMPTYMNGENFKVASLDDVLPEVVCRSLRYGLASFDKKINGFARPDALLSAAETRTSAPVRILRGENMTALGRENIYPCGEGAGYAGGITSAAVDGIKVAMAMIGKYRPID